MTSHTKFFFWYEDVNPRHPRMRGILEILHSYGIGIILAVKDLNGVIGTLRIISGLDIPIGLWPLLEEKYGYWINVLNARIFQEKIGRIINNISNWEVDISFIAIDLEPPLGIATDFLSHRVSLSDLFAFIKQNIKNFDRGTKMLSETIDTLHNMGYRVIAVAPDIPFEFDEATSRKISYLFGLPIYEVEADALSLMVYNSIISATLRIPLRTARWRMIRILTTAHKYLKKEIIPSIGAIWPGKLGNEPIYNNPEQLADDVSVLLAARFREIFIYNLEGLINRKDSETWIKKIMDAKPTKIKTSYRYEIARKVINIILKVISSVGYHILRDNKTIHQKLVFV